jgi:AP-1-like factor
MDESGMTRARSSSEEKEANLTPAQSRRKAQNRAAYALPITLWQNITDP